MSSVESATLGEVIGGYRLDAVLGAGSTSHVFLGVHTVLGRKAAIKVLVPQLLGNESVITRLLTEARVVNDIRHPNIVDITDFVRTDSPNRVALIMEHIEGPSLTKMRGSPLPFRTGLGIAQQLLAAIKAAHAAGVIHRDLKPDNLLFATDPRDAPDDVPTLKIVDFGIAKIARPTPAQTAIGQMLGTPAYMAPEQIAGRPRPTAATDVFAIGEVLYEILSGKRAYQTGTISETVRVKLRGDLPDLTLPGVPHGAEIQSWIEQCLSYRQEDRPQLEALLAAVDRWRSEPGSASADLHPVDTHLDEVPAALERFASERTAETSAPPVRPKGIPEAQTELASGAWTATAENSVPPTVRARPGLLVPRSTTDGESLAPTQKDLPALEEDGSIAEPIHVGIDANEPTMLGALAPDRHKPFPTQLIVHDTLEPEREKGDTLELGTPELDDSSASGNKDEQSQLSDQPGFVDEFSEGDLVEEVLVRPRDEGSVIPGPLDLGKDSAPSNEPSVVNLQTIEPEHRPKPASASRAAPSLPSPAAPSARRPWLAFLVVFATIMMAGAIWVTAGRTPAQTRGVHELEITSEPSGAEVYNAATDTRIGATPMPYQLSGNIDAMEVWVRKPGFAPQKIALTAARSAFHVTLQPAP